MSLIASLAMIAQASAPVASAPPARSQPIAVSVRASVRVIRATAIRIEDSGQVSDSAQAVTPQRERDQAGTLWIEFN